MKNPQDEFETKSERREKRKENSRKMRVSGKSNILLWQITQEKAAKIKRKGNGSRKSSKTENGN